MSEYHFTGFTPDTGAFLWDLAFHNERPWFNENKQRFLTVLKEPFDALGRETLAMMEQRFPDRPWQLHISRIYRDARRLFGRGPYKDHLWFTVWDGADKHDSPAFWFEISGAGWQYGVGFFEARPSEMEAYRRFIRENPAAVEKLDRKLRARRDWDLIGPEYKRPRGDLGERLNRWYNKKWMGISAEHDFEGAVLDPGLPGFLAKEFAAMMPFYEFFLQFRQEEDENYSDM
jgi:uncharacterized protein (TIGR02453 family)